MGSTIRAAIALYRKQRARRIIAAAPGASPWTAGDLARTADEEVVLEEPLRFSAAAQVYEDAYNVSDEEVIRIMDEYDRIKESGPCRGRSQDTR